MWEEMIKTRKLEKKKLSKVEIKIYKIPIKRPEVEKPIHLISSCPTKQN